MIATMTIREDSSWQKHGKLPAQGIVPVGVTEHGTDP